MRGAERSQGIDRQALVCQGGCVEVIGSDAINHSAHFTGLLDEVKLYGRALTDEEVRKQYQQFAQRAAR